MTPAGTGVSSRTGGSGRWTCAIGRFSESRGMPASSPTPGKPVVSSFGTRAATGAGPDDCVKDMPDEAV